MSKKKNPAAMLAGIVAMVLGVAIIVIAALAVAGIISLSRPAGNGKVENSTEESGSAVLVEEEKCRDLEWQTADAAPEDVTATVETEAGSFVLKLYPGAAADKFAERNIGAAHARKGLRRDNEQRIGNFAAVHCKAHRAVNAGKLVLLAAEGFRRKAGATRKMKETRRMIMRRTKMAVLGMMMVLSVTACAGKAELKNIL